MFSYLADSGKIVLLLDGFDEIHQDSVGDIVLELELLQQRHPDLKIIVSSRPQNSIQNAPGFQVIELVGLDSDDYDPFLTRLGIETTKRFDLVEAIINSPENIAGIIHTPLMLTLVVLVYQTEKEIPSTLPEFFEKLFGVVFGKHDKLKAGFNRQHFSGLSERRLQHLFETFCFISVHYEFGRTLKVEDFNAAFDKALSYSADCECDVEGFRRDIVNVACLMLEEGVDLTTFLHKSILEYHAAAFVKRSSEVFSIQFYDQAILHYRKWQYVLPFLQKIDSYRYARDYLLKILPEQISTLSNLLADKNDGELIRFIYKIQPELCIAVDGYSISYWGVIRPGSSEFEDEFTAALTSTFSQVINRSLDRADIEKAIAQSKDSFLKKLNLKERNIDMKSFIEVFGSERIWAKIGILEADMAGLLFDSRALIAKEESKKEIFHF